MKLFTALIASFALISGGAAVSISADPGRYPVPKDLADGLYFVTPKATSAGARTGSAEGDFKLVAAYGTEEWFGNATAKSVESPNANVARAYPSLSKRFPGPISFGLLSNDELNHSDVLDAQNAMKSFCDSGNKVPPHTCAVWRVRGAFTQVDNRGEWNPCSSGEWNEAVAFWNNQGWAWKPVYIMITQWAKGYVQKFSGDHAC